MTTDVFARNAAFDPAAEPGLEPDWQAIDTVLLAAIDGRTSTVSTNLKPHPPASTEGRRWRSAWVAAAAFAIVILAAIAVLLAFDRNPDDVVDVSAPPFDSTRDAVDAWMRLAASGTAEEIHSILAPDYSGFFLVGPTVAETEERIAFERAIGTRAELGACTENSPDLDLV